MFDGSTLLLALAYAVAMIAESVVVTRSHWTHPHFALLLLGITTVAFFGVFAAMAVDKPTNSAAVFGLLGVLAGYLAGRSEKKDESAATR
jgi:hypothetical protein